MEHYRMNNFIKDIGDMLKLAGKEEAEGEIAACRYVWTADFLRGGIPESSYQALMWNCDEAEKEHGLAHQPIRPVFHRLLRKHRNSRSQ